jgi:hypothetical protein
MKKPKNVKKERLVFLRNVPTINPLQDKNIVTIYEAIIALLFTGDNSLRNTMKFLG